MNPLGKLAPVGKVTEATDSVGGSFILESGVHDMKIDTAYFGESTGGATSVNITFKGNGNTLRQVIYVTSGRAKGQKSTYTDRNGEEHYLPGYTTANDICLLAVGKGIGEVDTDEKMVNVYDFSLRKEVPTKVLMIMDLLNQDITLGVIKQTVDTNIKNGEGKYVPSGDTRDENEVDKVFRTSDRMTVLEVKSKSPIAVFVDAWKEKWDGKTRNRAVGAKASGATSGAPTGTKSGMFD